MTRPRRPLINERIILSPATFIGGKDRLFIRHDNNQKFQRIFGVVIMSHVGLNLLNSQMRTVDKAVLIALISKLKWFEIDYEETRSGDKWELHYDFDGISIKAKIKESGIATTGLTHEDIVGIIFVNSDPLLEMLSESYAAINVNSIDRDRAIRTLNASKKSRYSIKQIKLSIDRLKSIGVIIGSERAGPDKLYYILNPYFYCNGPAFMRNALIRFIRKPVTGSVVQFSEDLSNSGPPRRRKTNSILIHELEQKNDFIKEVLEIHTLPEVMQERGHLLLLDADDSGGNGQEHTPQGSKEER